MKRQKKGESKSKQTKKDTRPTKAAQRKLQKSLAFAIRQDVDANAHQHGWSEEKKAEEFADRYSKMHQYMRKQGLLG
jgi:hypothetical protein